MTQTNKLLWSDYILETPVGEWLVVRENFTERGYPDDIEFYFGMRVRVKQLRPEHDRIECYTVDAEAVSINRKNMWNIEREVNDGEVMFRTLFPDDE